MRLRMGWLWRLRDLLRRLGPVWLPVAGLFALLLVVLGRRLDPDFGWHLEAGRYILQHGIPTHDVFSYTATDFRWINHEWLSDVFTSVLYTAGGFGLVASVFAAVWTAAIVLAARLRLWLVYALGFIAIAAEVVARANAWTALGLALVLWTVRRDVRLSGRLAAKRRWWLVPMFALWANLHGGFVIGFIALAVAAVRDRKWWPVLAVSGLATFLNPYGPELYVEIWRTVADPQLRWLIAEWQPLAIGALNGFYICLFLAVVLASRWRYELVFPLLMLAASVSSQRQFPLFMIASLGLIAEGYVKLIDALNARAGWRRFLLPVVVTGLALVPAGKIMENPHNNLPERGIASLRREPCTGRLFNEYNFGGYVIWQLPGTKVYIDGRMPSWRNDEVYYLANWRRVLDDESFARSELARYGVKCALLEKQHGRLIRQLVAEGWDVSAMDDLAVLLRKR